MLKQKGSSPSKSGSVPTLSGIFRAGLKTGTLLLGCALLSLVPASKAMSEGLPGSTAEGGPEHIRSASSSITLAKGPSEPAQKYHWLFKDAPRKEAGSDTEKTAVFDRLDREIKEARRLYLAGESDNAVLKYRSAVDHLEALLDDIPAGHGLLREGEQRLSLYDELVTKILGPVNQEPKEEQAGLIFHLTEKRRICKRNLALRKAGDLAFFDVPWSAIQEESSLLQKLAQTREEPPDSASKKEQEQLKLKLAEVRKSLLKSSPRYARLRKGIPVSLAEIRRDLLHPDEMILDFNMFSDRMLVGIITTDKATYHQVPVNRGELDKGVLQLQERLREFATGERETFMGHAWKEQCRRTYRTLFGQLPPLPDDKRTVFVIPDRSLWYLPLSALLDPEDRPVGGTRMVSLIPSAEMLSFVRTMPGDAHAGASAKGLLLFESIPWIPEEELKGEEGTATAKKQAAEKLTEEERIERLILTNPVYPKPSDIAVQLQKMFKKASVWAAQAATIERFAEQVGSRGEVGVWAIPLAMTDAITRERQPTLFFSPDKQGQRSLPVSALFSTPLASRMLILPVSWVDIQEKEGSVGEGPLLLATAMFYTGVKVGMISYSDPNWGSDAPFLEAILKMIAQGVAPGKALTEYARELPSALDTSFTGKPPAWAGWIVMGDPR